MASRTPRQVSQGESAMPTYKDALNINERYAKDNGKEESAVKILLMHHSGLSSTNLVSELDKTMPKERYDKFRKAVDEYIIKNRPVQHITKQEYFHGHPFTVSPSVMIPRFETEELVAYTLEMIDERFNGEDKIDLLDIGTGSGCLAITIALEEPRIRATGTDISKDALSVAIANSEHLDAGVRFLEGNLVAPVANETFDVIISNPPYIPNGEQLEPIVKDHEPHIALFGGEDGLDYYRRILSAVGPMLKPRFIIALEHACDQAKPLKKMIKKELGNVSIIQKKDLQGKDRMTFITNRD